MKDQATDDKLALMFDESIGDTIKKQLLKTICNFNLLM